MHAFDIDSSQVARNERVGATIPIAWVCPRNVAQALDEVLVLHVAHEAWPILRTGAANLAERATAAE
jgi:hypothetical protein